MRDFLTAIGLVLGNLIGPGAADAPWWVYLGGPLGVVFVASGSWLVARIGAINTALLVVGGQMVSGVAFDLMRSAAPSAWLSGLGVALILAGMALTQKRS